MTNPAGPFGNEPTAPGFDEPPAQPPTQPNLEARPDMMPPPPPGAPMGPPAGYGQYVPLAPPAPKRRGGTVGLVVLVIALVLGGGAAGYFLLGDSDDGGGEAAIDDNTSAPESEEPEDETEPSEEEPGSEPEGDTIPIESLGAQIPFPSEAWQPTFGPGEDNEDMSDSGGLAIQYEENWYATFQVGQYAVVELPYDSADIAGTATELARFWAEQSAASGTSGEYTDPETRELTVDGRSAVIAESTASWETSEYTSDTYEHVVVFLVDVDGINALYGTAWVPESAESEYENVLSAFETTSFEE